MATESENTTNRVYILDNDFGWLPAKVISSIGKSAEVEVRDYEDDILIPACEVSSSLAPTTAQKRRGDKKVPIKRLKVNLKDYSGGVLPLQNVDEDGKLVMVEDMVDLSFLHEAAILYNLKKRHGDGHPYTRTGDIVIAVNPYQWIHDLYSDETRALYAEKLLWDVEEEGDPRAMIPPHVYETSSLAYRGLIMDGQDQSVLVSGESGAGKTETVKILMSHIASFQYSATNDGNISPIVQRVLDSNPLLEAFGNAKTLRNDNSSRFGKFIQLQFDAEDPTEAAFSGRNIPSAVLGGSKCETYLLEKSRVNSHEDGERSYHIFYQILAASEDQKAEIWSGLANTDNESFNYVGYTDTTSIEGKSDGEGYQHTKDALALIGVNDGKFIDLMRAICIVMQLGNLTFDHDPKDDEYSVISSKKELKELADLMGLDQEVVRKSLTEKTIQTSREVLKVKLDVDRAKDSCDALSKEIYSNTFDWLVKTINNATCAEENYKTNPNANFSLIGLLDIFGFESFAVNRFEQLCINYANEKLQQKFTIDIFRSVQEEYEAEGIALGEVEFSDNAEVLNLIEGRMGLISVLNEECVRPKGNDISFVKKVYNMNDDSACLLKGRFYRDWEFGLKHYAGDVVYDANNFVTKNMDSLPVDLTDCRKKSTNTIVSCDIVRNVARQTGRPKTPTAKRGGRAGGRGGGRKSSLNSATVWTKFRSQLGELMTNISETRSRYIRCIKPNTMKEPRMMQHITAVEQLRCAGVVAAVTISRSAFPNRLEHNQVLHRFMCLEKSFHRKSNDVDTVFLKEDTENLLTRALKSQEVDNGGAVTKAFVCGKTRTYFRTGSLEHLENKRLFAFGDHAKDLQRIVRGFVKRSQYLRIRNAAITVQAQARFIALQTRYLEMRAASIIIQCWSRGNFSKRSLYLLRRNNRAAIIQSRWRMAVALAMFKELKTAAVTIQACARGARQRPLFRVALKEAVEEAKLENQLKALQKRLEEAETKRIEAEKRADEGSVHTKTKTVVVYKDAEGSEENKAEVPAAKVNVEQPPAPVLIGQLSEKQQSLIDESGQMLKYLRKEVFKLRSQNSQLKNDNDLMKENNQRLMDANASAGASFAALNQRAKQLSKTNGKLQQDVVKYKQQAHTLNLAQVELKEELKMKQGTYIAEVHSRLQYQKTMASIVDVIQENCRDHRLVEDVLAMSDDCESDYMSGPTGVDLTPKEDEHIDRTIDHQESLTSRFKSFLFSPNV